MPKTPTPSVPVDADRPRNLRFTASAIARLEEAYDQPIAVIFNRFMDQVRTGQPRLRMILELATAGLQHEDETLTWQKLGDGMDLSEIPRLIGPVGEALKLSFPAPKEGAADPNAPGPPSA
jgi:hypothetical protein